MTNKPITEAERQDDFLKYLRQLLIILGTYFIGQVIQAVFSLPVPGSVIGLLLLFFALHTGILKVHMIEEVCDFLLNHMAFLFVPAGVGLMTSFGLIRGKLAAFLAVIILSTAIIWLITAFIAKLLRKGKLYE